MDSNKYVEERENDPGDCPVDASLCVKTTEDEYNALPEDAIATKEEVTEAIETAYRKIPNFHKRLLFFTLKWVQTYFHSDMIRDLTVEDVVQTVLTKILSLDRKWKKNRFPEIADFIRLAIISFIRNEQKRKEVIDFDDVYDESPASREKNFEDLVKQIFTEDIADSYLREPFEELFVKCEDLLKDDVYASFVFEERMNGIKSNIKIAENLQIEVKDVEKALQRIRRKLDEPVGKALGKREKGRVKSEKAGGNRE